MVSRARGFLAGAGVGRAAALAIALLLAACGSKTPDALDASVAEDASLAPIPGELRPVVLSVWAAGDDEVWFAGGEAGSWGGMLARYDGQKIARVDAVPGAALWWVFGLDRTQIWAVGDRGRSIALRNGAWVDVPTGLPETSTLWGVWGTSADDLWAVGVVLTASGQEPVILRSNGAGGWRRISDPVLAGAQGLYKVWGSGPNDVFIVGEAGVSIYWDGTRFRRLDTGTTDPLFTVHGRPNGTVLAVGGRASARILRFERNAWVNDNPPVVPGLSGVYVRADGTAYAVGSDGTILTRDTAGKWHEVPVERPAGTLAPDLHAVWSGRYTWAVGGYLLRGHDGTIFTDKRPFPTYEVGAPIDGGILDARVLDAGFVDAGAVDAGGGDGGSGGDGGRFDAMTSGDGGARDGGVTTGDGGRADAVTSGDGGGGATDATGASDAVTSGDRGAVDAISGGDGGGGGDGSAVTDGSGGGDGSAVTDGSGGGDGSAVTDGSGGGDGSAVTDGSGGGDGSAVNDGGGGRDGGALNDGGAGTDGGPGDDAGPTTDAGSTIDAGTSDASPPDSGRPGPGQPCPGFSCEAGLMCLPIQPANWAPVCTRPCSTVNDCGDFGPDTCCMIPGPQTFQTYCVPRRILTSGQCP